MNRFIIWFLKNIGSLITIIISVALSIITLIVIITLINSLDFSMVYFSEWITKNALILAIIILLCAVYIIILISTIAFLIVTFSKR